ncbi:hypothetical protein LCGC14_0436970 [marine sediment metagenome]|uniref:Uncharacterized protein n=1 Tax=marine sediment metagenome TaxID=412755 RepID=A0A0F9VVX7_9ZZZZ
MNDDATGFLVVPARYAGEDGRERIDDIRDSMSDHEFAVGHCRGAARKYDDRNKSEYDPEKRRWYLEMALHVLSHGDFTDPRSNRPGFVPYKRASMPEPLPERRIDVLDHGFVRFVEDWGHGDSRMPEAGIIEAARQSTQGCFRGWRQDAKLLRYLYENKHSTPFEFAGMVLEVRAPIFIFRQWHRHRTQGYNEMSARYTELPDLTYIPTVDRIVSGSQTTANKQAAAADGAPVATERSAEAFRGVLKRGQKRFRMDYDLAIGAGVPKELARLGMPVNHYSQMRATTCLRNWLGFLTLRMDPHAQWEIRQYANAVHALILERFPETCALFDETRDPDRT